MDKERQRKIGIVLSYVVMASNFLVGLVYTPYLIRSLGQSEFGNYNYVNSVANYLTLLTCGFGSAYLRFATPYRKNNDNTGIDNINGLFLSLFFLMGFIAFILGGMMTWRSDWILSGKLTGDELRTGKILMGILSLNVFMTFPVSIFNSYVIAQEEFVFQKTIALIRTLLGPLISVIVLQFGCKAVGIAFVTLCITILVDSSTIVYCVRKLGMRFKFHFVNWKQIKEVFVFSGFLLLSMIVDQVNWSVDKYLLGKICGTAVVAVYSVGATINTYYMSMGEAISNVYVPRVYDLLCKDDGDYEVSLLMTKLGRVQFLVLSLICTGFIIFGRVFIRLWVGNEYLTAYYVILLLIIPVTIPEIQKIGLEIQKAKNLHKFRSVIYALIALVNILLTIPFAHQFGATGAALSTAITVLVGNGIIMNIYYKKRVNVDIGLFWNGILKLVPSVTISLVIGFLISYIPLPENWLWFGIDIVVYTMVYCFVIYKFGLNQEEKDLITHIVNRHNTHL